MVIDLYQDSFKLIDLYAIIDVNFRWIFIVMMVLNYIATMYYLSSQGSLVSGWKFVPFLNELCLFDCTQHKLIVISDMIIFAISYLFYSVPLFIIGLVLRAVFLNIARKTWIEECNTILFFLIAPYRWYVMVIEGLKTRAQKEIKNTAK